MNNLKDFPQSPGVYIHKNKQGDIIYIGKAKNLRKRIASYFNNSNLETKNQFLIQNINSTEYIMTNNELEALLLENQLIKKHKPKYNIELKDAVKYFYIQITKEDFPRILVTRKTNKTDLFFGPYTGSIKGFIKILKDFFKIRSCTVMPKKSCIYKDMNLCLAPCVNNVSKEEYKKVINEVIRFIKSGDDNLLDEYYDQMEECSKRLDFESALELRKKIDLLKRLKQKQIVDVINNNDFDAIGIANSSGKAYICVLSVKRGVLLNKKMFTFVYCDDLLNQFLKLYYSKFFTPNEIIVCDEYDNSIEEYLSSIWGKEIKIKQVKSGQKAEIVELAKKNAYFGFKFEDQALIEIKEMLKLEKLPEVIDCFDISNIGESLVVGACVQFKNSVPNTSAWQLFNVEGNFGQDDFRAIHEVVKRRYEKHPLPDLIVIDGGAIQIDFAIKALKELNLKSVIVGLAKKEETIIFQDGNSLLLNRKKEGSKLLIKIRNSTHNFVIKHCRKSFTNIYKKSELDDIKGIGPIIKFKLLNHFKSIDAIKKASSEELALIVGDKVKLR